MESDKTVYIIDAKRTPIGKRNGSLSDIHPVDLLGNLIKETVKMNSINPENIDDVIAGCVDQTGNQAINIARNAWLSAGFPESVPGVTVDRQCGSSLQALQFAANGIVAKDYGMAIACGVESMTRVPMFSTIKEATPITDSLRSRYGLSDEWFSQANGAELIAKKYNISRQDMDLLSYNSHIRANRAREIFAREIIPVKSNEKVILSEDEGIRQNPDLEKMNSLASPFHGITTITAGNSSQISDGASVAILAGQEAVDKFNLKSRAKIVATGAVAVDPVTMLEGPIPVTEKLLRRSGRGMEDIDVFEVNEAFASVVLAWEKELKVSPEKVNINGGAIALGHPLGATGTRIISTMLNTLETEKMKTGLIAICEGGGMANGAIIERLD